MTELQKRPRIDLPLSTGARILEIASWLLLAVLWILTIYYYGKLPDQVPVHFNASGTPDSYGSPEAIFLLPAITSILFAGLTALNKHPEIFNYPVSITEENAAILYMQATNMIRFVKFIIILIFLVIEYKIIHTALGKMEGLGAWFLPVFLLVIFLPVAGMSIKMFRTARNQKK